MYYRIKPIVQIHVPQSPPTRLMFHLPTDWWSYESLNKIRASLRHLGAFREDLLRASSLSRISSYISLLPRARCGVTVRRIEAQSLLARLPCYSFHGGDSIRIAVPCSDGEP